MGYTPLAEYGLIGNDDRCALVSSDGSIDWCCFPHVASPSVFARLLDADRGGQFVLRPTDSYDAHQQYLDRTNILQTTFETDSGRAVLTDFMPVSSSGAESTFQPAIYRRLRCAAGTLRVECEFVPRFDYARAETTIERVDDPRDTSTDDTTPVAADDSAHDRLVAHGGDEPLFVQSHGPLSLDTKRRDRAVGFQRLTEGETLWVGLQYGEHSGMSPKAYRRSLTATREYWEEWVAEFEAAATQIVDNNPWYEHVVRSGLVLKLLINSGSGAIYAAPTTSLPEQYGGDHNWDYRYNWIRDAKFTVQALYNFGRTEEAERYFEWFRSVSDDDPAAIQPLYGVHGETDLEEFELDHLAGYRHSNPVRVGNAAFSQQQTDVYGAIIQGIYETLQHGETLSTDDWDSIRAIINHVCECGTNLMPVSGSSVASNDTICTRNCCVGSPSTAGSNSPTRVTVSIPPTAGKPPERRFVKPLSTGDTARPPAVSSSISRLIARWMRARCWFRSMSSCRLTTRAWSRLSRPYWRNSLLTTGWSTERSTPTRFHPNPMRFCCVPSG